MPPLAELMEWYDLYTLLNPFAGNLFGVTRTDAGARVAGLDVVVTLTVVGVPLVLVAKNF